MTFQGFSREARGSDRPGGGDSVSSINWGDFNEVIGGLAQTRSLLKLRQLAVDRGESTGVALRTIPQSSS